MTREDVLRLKEEHDKEQNGTESLNFSNKKFVGRVDLSSCFLSKADFSSASLPYANLSNASLLRASFYRADCFGTNFSGSSLNEADFRNANLREANINCSLVGTRLQGAQLWGSHWGASKTFGDVDWGSYILGDELKGEFIFAEPLYRELRLWHQGEGYSDKAAHFYYREMECKKKQAKRDKDWSKVAGLSSLHLLFGYGERPERTIVWALAVILIFSFLFSAIGMKRPDNSITSDWFEALYLSAVSFTALGYGSWALEPLAWGRFLGVIESFLGVFTMALFVTLFVRKMAR